MRADDPASGLTPSYLPGSVEAWAWSYLHSRSLAEKSALPPLRAPWSTGPGLVSRRVEAPGRPPELRLVTKAPKAPGPEALRSPERRAQLAHTFWHHELQAAELNAWALLAFPEAPRAFRRGLLRVAWDEVRHMAMYADYLRGLGHALGDFPVRDWFWTRVPSARTPLEFVAVLGLGFEGGNLDHTVRFASKLRAVGDEEGARLQETIAREEIPHVRFARHWFERWSAEGGTFEAWRQALPPPLSPWVMRGSPLNLDDRRRAGLSESFLEDLERWQPSELAPSGS